MGRKPSKKKARKEAEGEVASLMEKAVEIFASLPSRAHDYVRKARRAAMRVQMPIKRELKRRICKHCYHLLVPGKNCRIRVHKSRVIVYCLDCKHHTRIPVK